MQPDPARVYQLYQFELSIKPHGAKSRTAKRYGHSRRWLDRQLRLYRRVPRLDISLFQIVQPVPLQRAMPRVMSSVMSRHVTYGADREIVLLSRFATLLLAACAVVAACRDLGLGLGLWAVSCGAFYSSIRLGHAGS